MHQMFSHTTKLGEVESIVSLPNRAQSMQSSHSAYFYQRFIEGLNGVVAFTVNG